MEGSRFQMDGIEVVDPVVGPVVDPVVNHPVAPNRRLSLDIVVLCLFLYGSG